MRTWQLEPIFREANKKLNKGVSAKTVVKNIKKALIDVIESPDTISVEWCTEDVISQANDMGIPITEDQARWALALVDDNHDCNYGITWDHIRDAIDQVMEVEA